VGSKRKYRKREREREKEKRKKENGGGAQRQFVKERKDRFITFFTNLSLQAAQ